jgi:hypothetical protein
MGSVKLYVRETVPPVDPWPRGSPRFAVTHGRWQASCGLIARHMTGLAWAAAVVAVLSIAAVAVVVLHRPATAHRARQAAASSATPASSATATSSATTGWTAYRDPGGFSIKIPPGWAIHTRTATEVTFSPAAR